LEIEECVARSIVAVAARRNANLVVDYLEDQPVLGADSA